MQQGFAQPGDQWIPSDAAEKEQNVRLMEEMCTKPPTSIDERMTVIFAGHGLLTSGPGRPYTMVLDINVLHTSIQLDVAGRSLELHREVLPPPQPADAELFQHQLKPIRKVLTRPSAPLPTHPVTAIDIKSFEANPFAIVGLTFILQSAEGGGGGVLYEVAEMGSSKKEVWYQVQFEGCADFIQIDQEEMMEMVKDIVLLTT